MLLLNPRISFLLVWHNPSIDEFPSEQMFFHHALNFHSINEFFHHCLQTRNLREIKKFQAHLLRTGLFFISPNLQTRLIFTHTCLNENNPTSLTNFLKCLNPRNPLPFNSIISHFCQNGSHSLALEILSFMHFNGVYLDSYALCSSLTSLSCTKNVYLGKMMHTYVQKSGWLSSVFVGSALVDLYAKLLCVDDAAKVFDEIPGKNTVCVNALLSGYAEAKMWDELIQLARIIPGLNLDVDNFTLTAVLRACVGLCEVELGRQIHAIVLHKFDLGVDVFLQSLLIEMYGKCGLLERARRVFDMVGFQRNGERKTKRDIVLWTSILGVYGRNGDYMEVIRLFGKMMDDEIRPDGVAFLTVISACSHTGQVEVGLEYFKSMSLYGLAPSSEHYSALMDLLCRAGELEKAWELVGEMPHGENGQCSISMWGTLLSACNECGNVELGKLVAERALELEPRNVGIYVLLSNMYARNSMWDEIGELRELMKFRGLKKDIGWSSIGVTNYV